VVHLSLAPDRGKRIGKKKRPVRTACQKGNLATDVVIRVNPPLDSIYGFGISAVAAGDLARALVPYYTSCVPELQIATKNLQNTDLK